VNRILDRLVRGARAFGLPSLLLLIVAVTHMSYDLIGSFYPDPAIAARNWAHVLRAFPEATLLYLLVWLLTPWEPVIVRYAASAVCAWGALESFQIAACRLQFPMGKYAPNVKPFTGLCDVATGWPIYMLTVGAVPLVLLFVMKPRKKARDE
jgi:hypothetical protein